MPKDLQTLVTVTFSSIDAKTIIYWYPMWFAGYDHLTATKFLANCRYVLKEQGGAA